MERVRRLAQFWNWLPAFRAIAETEHLPTAAAALGVSAPGLSRMLKLIEDALDQKLFERHARRLQLNEAGRLLLRHVRDAMRRVDDGVAALADQSFVGSLRVAASNSASMVYLLPALRELAEEHPRLIPELLTLDEREVSDRLLNGDIDLALLEHHEASDELEVERLGKVTYGIYCGLGHPLATAKKITLGRCLEHPFVAAGGGAQDAWPLNLRRQIALRVNALNLAMAACAGGTLLALLPDDVASAYPLQLRRLEVGTLAEHAISIAHRPLLDKSDRVAVLMEALRRVAEGRPQSRR